MSAYKSKPGSVTDHNMVRKAISNANEAFAKLDKAKTFTVTVRGSVWGNKHGSVIENSVAQIRQNILKKKEQHSVLKNVTIRLNIHDSATMLDFNKVLPIIDKIRTGVADFVGKACRVNFSSKHVKDTALKFCYEVSFSEEAW